MQRVINTGMYSAYNGNALQVVGCLIKSTTFLPAEATDSGLLATSDNMSCIQASACVGVARHIRTKMQKTQNNSERKCRKLKITFECQKCLDASIRYWIDTPGT